MTEHAKEPTLAELNERVREVEAVQQLILRVMASTKPLDAVLGQYGATDTQERAVYRLLDGMAARAAGPEIDRPTFGYFQSQFAEIFPALRKDLEFMQLVIETLKLERPAYRGLSTHIDEQGWLRLPVFHPKA